MQKLQIYRKGLSNSELDDLRQLLDEAGASAKSAELVNEVPPPDHNCDDEVVFFLLTDQVMGQIELDGELAKVMNGGRRAICIWPAEGATAAPSAGINKFSYSIVSWNPNSLSKALANDDSTCFETPTGEKMQPPATKRLECDEEDE